MIKNSRLKKPFKLSAAQIILLGFASFILVGAFLLCLPISNTSHEWSSFVDALFTSTSSVCVTGLMVYDVAIELSVFGQVVVMILIQFGGLGFVAVASLLFLLIGKKIAGSPKNIYSIERKIAEVVDFENRFAEATEE